MHAAMLCMQPEAVAVHDHHAVLRGPPPARVLTGARASTRSCTQHDVAADVAARLDGWAVAVHDRNAVLTGPPPVDACASTEDGSTSRMQPALTADACAARLHASRRRPTADSRSWDGWFSCASRPSGLACMQWRRPDAYIHSCFISGLIPQPHSGCMVLQCTAHLRDQEGRLRTPGFVECQHVLQRELADNIAAQQTKRDSSAHACFPMLSCHHPATVLLLTQLALVPQCGAVNPVFRRHCIDDAEGCTC